MPRFHRLKVLRRLPHPYRGFTQGLVTDGGTVWESAGLYGQSELRRYQLGQDEAPDCAVLPPELFAEGICRVGEHIWQLTWRERVALRWDARSLTLLETISYNREGWGICAAGGQVLTSDGSSELVVRDPGTLHPLGLIVVRCGGQRIGGLNDLEWAGGRVWANVAPRSWLAGIDPASGEVVDIVDARAATERHRGDHEAILNGITALPAPGEFLLTGKGFRSLYHVRLAEGRSRRRPGRLLAG
ncbi:MAG TPA: glutaminyl-peptide cyclotransferase [Streptosporangiaceae bacterium]|nr:glutaminyl-peptide cyclotransferase [Streptosporangiaceae bacterium]